MTVITRAITRACGALALCLGALSLGGCVTAPSSITSNVQSFAQMQQVELPATYRLEVLPSQMQEASFAQVEAAAEAALAKVGLTRDVRPDLARLVVQVGASAGQGRDWHPAHNPYYYGPRFTWGLGYGFGHGGWHGSWGMHGLMMDAPPLVHLRAVKLVLRDQQSQRIVYETSAQYDEVRVHDEHIWQLLFEAALTGFPAPPTGLRSVRTQLPVVPAQPAP